MDDRARKLLAKRREELERALGRKLATPTPSDGPELSDSEWEHLRSTAAELYVNELAWENITDEEQVEGEPLSELTFPAFLAYVQGLLLDHVMPDSLAPANPRPEVVEEVLGFVAEQVVELRDQKEDPQCEEAMRTDRDLALTDRLLDLVLFRFHGVDPADVEGFRDAGAPAV